MNALAAKIVAAVHLFIRHRQQSPCSVLIWRGQLICIVDAFVAESILQPMYSQPPAVQTVCGGVMFSVNFVLAPSNLFHFVPSFLTLWPELRNDMAHWINGGRVMLFLGYSCSTFVMDIIIVYCTRQIWNWQNIWWKLKNEKLPIIHKRKQNLVTIRMDEGASNCDRWSRQHGGRRDWANLEWWIILLLLGESFSGSCLWCTASMSTGASAKQRNNWTGAT